MGRGILIVEDEAIVRLDLEQQLRNFGYTVLGSAATGEEAVAKAADLRPELILMDVRLKGGSMDGAEAARRIRSSLPVPILYVTAYAHALTDEETRAGQRFLSKPFHPHELQAAIQALLEPDESGERSSG